MLQMQLHTAVEGPLALNDHAFELCREIIQPGGGRLFTLVRGYENYLVEIAKKPGYQAGDALKFILPFLKAHGLTNARLRDFAGRNLRLLTGAAEAYRFLHGIKFPIFALSTNYRQFAEAVGTRLGFAAERIMGTELDLDRAELAPAEAEELKRLAAEILAAADIEWPAEAKAPGDLPGPAQEAIGVLDRIFLERLPQMEGGALLKEVKPAGGAEKAKFVADSLSKTGLKLEDTLYAGDSRSDVQALKAVKAGGGLAVSFNGDREAAAAAEVVVVSDCAWPMAMLCAIFRLWGKEGVLEIAAPETRAKSRALVLPEEMIEPIAMGLQGHLFNIYLSSSPNRGDIALESEAMRAKLREAGATKG